MSTDTDAPHHHIWNENKIESLLKKNKASEKKNTIPAALVSSSDL